MTKKTKCKQSGKCKGHERSTKDGQETSAFQVDRVGANFAACCKNNPALSDEAITAEVIARKAARKKKQQNKFASSPEEFCKKEISNHVNNSGSQGHPIDTLELCLRLHKNDVEALKKLQFVTIDEVVTAADPEKKTPMTTCGKNKLSFYKTVVDKPTTDGGKATPPYSDLQQKLVCRSSLYNVPGLHQDPDNVAQIRSFQEATLSRAFHRMLKSMKDLEDGKGRNQQAYRKNKGTQQMMAEHKAAGSMEEFRKFKMPALVLSLDTA